MNIKSLLFIFLMLPCLCIGQVKLVTIPSGRAIPKGGQNFPIGGYGQTLLHNGTNWTTFTNNNFGCELGYKTINIPAGATSAQVQALIDGVKKNLGGYTVDFIFADGTYNWSSTITFQDFFNGTVRIMGTTYNTGAANTNQGAKIYSSASPCIYLYKCQATVYVMGLYLQSTESSGYGSTIAVWSCAFGYVDYCAFNRTTKGGGSAGLSMQGSSLFGSYLNNYANISYGIYAQEMAICRSVADTFGSLPVACSICFQTYSGGIINYNSGTYNYTSAVLAYGAGGFIIRNSGGSVGS